MLVFQSKKALISLKSLHRQKLDTRLISADNKGHRSLNQPDHKMMGRGDVKLGI